MPLMGTTGICKGGKLYQVDVLIKMLTDYCMSLIAQYTITEHNVFPCKWDIPH